MPTTGRKFDNLPPQFRSLGDRASQAPLLYFFSSLYRRSVHGFFQFCFPYSNRTSLTWPVTPLLQLAFPNFILTTEQLGRAMIAVAQGAESKRILESRDILALS